METVNIKELNDRIQKESAGLKERQVDAENAGFCNKDICIYYIADCGCEAHNEGNSKAHTDSGINLGGAAQEGAAAEELGEDKVVYQDCSQRNGNNTG